MANHIEFDVASLPSAAHPRAIHTGAGNPLVQREGIKNRGMCEKCGIPGTIN